MKVAYFSIIYYHTSFQDQFVWVWEGIRMDCRDIGWEDWMNLTQDRHQGWAPMNMVMNLLVP